MLNLHHMRYECIALSLGCSGFAMTPLGLDSCLSAAFPGVVTFSSPMSHTRITSMYSNIIFLRHCDEEILAAERNKLSPSGLLITINHKNPPLIYQVGPKSTGGNAARKVRLNLHLCHLLQKSNTES